MTKITETHRAIVTGQNTAMEQWPTELSERQNLVGAFIRLQREQDAAITKAKSDAKDKVGADGALKKLVKDYAYEDAALKIVRTLDKMTDPEKRSRVCRQVFEMMKDQGYLIPELFDLGAVGTAQPGADAGATFDKTATGKAQGGKKNQPNPADAPQPQTQAGTGPGIPLDEAQRQLEAYLAANPRKPGAKSKALKELEAAVETAKAANPVPDVPTPNTPEEAAANAATIAAGIGGPDAPDEEEGPEFAELPTTDGPLGPQFREGVAESEAHIAAQVKAMENKPEPEPVAEKPARAKRPTKAQKEATAKAAAEAAASTAAVAGPDAPDEEDGPDFADLPPAPPAPIGGKTSSSVRFAN